MKLGQSVGIRDGLGSNQHEGIRGGYRLMTSQLSNSISFRRIGITLMYRDIVIPEFISFSRRRASLLLLTNAQNSRRSMFTVQYCVFVGFGVWWAILNSRAVSQQQ